MEILYQPVIDSIIRHSIKILNADYEDADEVFSYAKPGLYPDKIVELAETFGMMMVKLEARELALNESIIKLRAKEQEIRCLYQAFVEAIVVAIDARDAATAGHSRRMANYALALCHAINQTEEGKYQFTQFSAGEIQEVYYAALLHDVGKIGVREQVLLKKHRLSEERMTVINYRFKYYRQCLYVKEIREGLTADEKEILATIESYYEFIASINEREYISAEEEEKLIRIANFKFINEDGKAEAFLDEFEKENLLVKRGNLTDNERKAMNMHAIYTGEILKAIPWEKDQQNIAVIATGHHEKMDGSGYPRGLVANDIPIQSRMLAVIDIFDALTAFDRPYKPALSAEKAIEILQTEAKLGRLDKDILEIFCNKVVPSTAGQ